MNDLEQLQIIATILGDAGTLVGVFWLFMTEREHHEETRRDYRRDLRRMANLNDPTDPDD